MRDDQLEQLGKVAYVVVVLLLATSITMQMSRVDALYVPAATEISLTIDFGNGTVSSQSALEATDVYNLTTGLFEVDAVWAGNRVYINAIDGVYKDATRGWQFWVNGNYATGAANLYNLQDGDSVLWNLTVSSFQTSAEPDYSLVIGGVLLTAGGLAFLVILYWNQVGDNDYMKKKEILAFTLLIALVSMQMASGAMAYATDIRPDVDLSKITYWDVTRAPVSAFSMYFTGAGNCLIESGSNISFSVREINDDVSGFLNAGNVSIVTNDTLVARDLVLGVGIFSPFEPGLFVKVGASNFDSLNDSAYAAAARVSGNFMNGTMTSAYENVTVGLTEYEAITFDYVQDTPFAGDPQRTRLIYDIATGVLLYANTSYWFGEGFEPYWLEIEFIAIFHGGGTPPANIYPILIASVIIILLIVLIVRKRM